MALTKFMSCGAERSGRYSGGGPNHYQIRGVGMELTDQLYEMGIDYHRHIVSAYYIV